MRKEILKNAITATKLLQDYDEITFYARKKLAAKGFKSNANYDTLISKISSD